MEIKFKKLVENAVIPTFSHESDLGADITCTSIEYNEEKDYYIFHTGIAVELSKGINMLVFPRSSNRNKNAFLCNSVGVIDEAYRGEILLCYRPNTSYKVQCMLAEWEHMKKVTEGIKFDNDKNIGDTVNQIKSKEVEVFKKPDCMDFCPYEVGDRIGQLVIYKKIDADFVETDILLSDTERGDGGFGSTGK